MSTLRRTPADFLASHSPSGHAAVALLLLLSAACGGGGGGGGGTPTSPGPTATPTPAPSQISGTWRGKATSTNLDTNFCYGSGSATVDVTWRFTQTEATVQATSSVDLVPGSTCGLSGSVAGNTIALHIEIARSDQACYTREFVCQGSRYREELVADQSYVNGTVTGSNMTLEGLNVTRIFRSGTNDQVGDHRSSAVISLTRQSP